MIPHIHENTSPPKSGACFASCTVPRTVPGTRLTLNTWLWNQQTHTANLTSRVLSLPGSRSTFHLSRCLSGTQVLQGANRSRSIQPHLPAVCEFSSIFLYHKSVWGALPEYRRLSGLHNKNRFSRFWRLEVRGPAGSLPGSWMADFPGCAHMTGGRGRGSKLLGSLLVGTLIPFMSAHHLIIC